MTHDMLVFVAKTFGLLWMMGFFVVVVVLAYRPSRKAAHERAATFEPVGKSMISAGEEEAQANPRARSAKLRAGQRTTAPAEATDMSIFGFPNLASLGKLGA